MRALAFAATSLLVLSGGAVAADLPQPPIYRAVEAPSTWSGFYVGVNLGGGLGRGSSDFGVAGGPVFATVNNNLSGVIGDRKSTV